MSEPTEAPDASAAIVAAERLGSFVCNTAEDYARTGEDVRILDDYSARVHAYFGPLKASAHETHRRICEAENARAGPAERLSKIKKREMLDWKRREEESAARMAREEQERLRKREEDRQIERAVSQEAQGQKEEAAKTLDRPLLVPVVVAPAPVAPKLEGIRVSRSWDARIKDLRAYLAWIATAPERVHPEDLVECKLGPLRKLARETDGEIAIPGVEFYTAERIATR